MLWPTILSRSLRLILSQHDMAAQRIYRMGTSRGASGCLQAWREGDVFCSSYRRPPRLRPTLRWLPAQEFNPDCHLVKLGTMGEYGTPNIDIEEASPPWTSTARLSPKRVPVDEQYAQCPHC